MKFWSAAQQTLNKFQVIACVLIACLSLRLSAQSPETWKLLWAKPEKAEMLFTDRLGDVYTAKGDALVKYKSDGTLYRVYSNKSLGKITRVDATNPLKIIVFYQDLSRIVFVDNTLSESGEALRLENFEKEQVSQVCWSYDNGIWLYDPVNFNLSRLDQRLSINVDIRNLNQILGFAPIPQWMEESGNHLYMSIPGKGILQFDIFGTYLRNIPIRDAEQFHVSGEFVLYRNKNQELNVYSMKSLQNTAWIIPGVTFQDFSFVQNKLYLLQNDSLKAYQWILPE